MAVPKIKKIKRVGAPEFSEKTWDKKPSGGMKYGKIDTGKKGGK